jgi:hypothetical protein
MNIFDDCGLEFVSPGESVTASTTLTSLVKVPRRHCYGDLQVWKDSKLCQCGKKELAPHEKNEEIGGDHCALFYIAVRTPSEV